MNAGTFHKLMLDKGLITKPRKDGSYGTSIVRATFPEFLKSIGCRTGAEIGVNTGDYTQVLAEHLTGTFYAVDPWALWPQYVDTDISRRKGNENSLEKTEKCYQKAIGRLEKYSHVKILRQTSMQATITIPDDSLDMVYIDGNHQYAYVWIDLCGFWSKLRPGGVMSGHDIQFSAVLRAVKEFVAKFKIPYWYIMENEPGTSTKSFFLIKG